MNFTGLKWRYQPGLLEGLGKKPFPCLFSFGRLPASLCLWPLPLSAKLTSVLLQILLLSSHLLFRRWLFCLLFHLKGPLWLDWDVHMIQDNLSRKKKEKKAERQRTDAFELWCWRLLSPLDKIIKPVNPKGNQPWPLLNLTFQQCSHQVHSRLAVTLQKHNLELQRSPNTGPKLDD